MLLAGPPGRILLKVGVEDRGAAGVALAVGTRAQTLQGMVDVIEHGRRPGQLGLVVLFHQRAG